MLVRVLESHAANFELMDAYSFPSAKIDAAVRAVLAPEPFVPPRQVRRSGTKYVTMNQKRLRLGTAIETARDRRGRITDILLRHDIRSNYLPRILLWFMDAADFRARAAAIQRNLETILKRQSEKRDALARFLTEFRADSGLAQQLEIRGAQAGRVISALDGRLEDLAEEPKWLRFFYFVGGTGRKSDAGRELHALLMNFIGMWKEVKGELPKVQPNIVSKEIDDEGNLIPQPFIRMTRSLLQAVKKDDLLPFLQNAAVDARKQFKRPKKSRRGLRNPTGPRTSRHVRAKTG
jgi:hypothetical protein